MRRQLQHGMTHRIGHPFHGASHVILGSESLLQKRTAMSRALGKQGFPAPKHWRRLMRIGHFTAEAPNLKLEKS